MADTKVSEKILSRVNVDRRGFVRKVVAGTAFAVPVVSSFSMDGLTTSAAAAGFSGNITRM
jgi:hypothetical protein